MTSSRCGLGDGWWTYRSSTTVSKAWNFKRYQSCEATLLWILVSAMRALCPLLHGQNIFLSLPLSDPLRARSAVSARPLCSTRLWAKAAVLPFAPCLLPGSTAWRLNSTSLYEEVGVLLQLLPTEEANMSLRFLFGDDMHGLPTASTGMGYTDLHRDHLDDSIRRLKKSEKGITWCLFL